jgi:hypothetical protein
MMLLEFSTGVDQRYVGPWLYCLVSSDRFTKSLSMKRAVSYRLELIIISLFNKRGRSPMLLAAENGKLEFSDYHRGMGCQRRSSTPRNWRRSSHRRGQSMPGLCMTARRGHFVVLQTVVTFNQAIYSLSSLRDM